MSWGTRIRSVSYTHLGTGGKLTVTATAENAGFPGARLTASKEITLKGKDPGPEYADELQLAPAEDVYKRQASSSRR